MSFKTVFITGSDTGVGKTLVTALLLRYLRQSGGHALAIKPFCTGMRTDVEILRAIQDGALKLEQINPFYFPEPLAPLVAARKHCRRITLGKVLDHIRQIQNLLQSFPSPTRHSTLLIEGAGGLLAPLGSGYTALEIIARLRCEVI